MSTGLKLGVNIDHIASIRQARRTTYPDIIEAAWMCEVADAHGITVHLREDRRHIQDKDVYDLRKSIKTRLNLEMANSPEIVAIALHVHPDEVCMVPEKREELTTEGGLDVAGQLDEIGQTVSTLKKAGMEVSLFIDADRKQIEAAAKTGASYIELHTGTYCDLSGAQAAAELERLVAGAMAAHELGLNVNAGHGINLGNLAGILEMPYLDTLNIGHSIVARSVFVGLERAVKEMLVRMGAYQGGRA
ncbi:MAG: pyridoxine 5'-phosphate synthase [Verrucomicrobia bacterium]|nr:pyridoxine 5'-phosphate synthase [Verrucomicrobiota bacterium]